ncbi:MAG TPA: tyrosine-type recombinase/integrase [Candidatus Binataceae bacterium]|nr:tyrosine-type recombinase/integrase [Candidatus Binataceae bacterium]
MNTIALPPLLQGFFYDWLIKQRDVSPHTVRSYRDAWKLFLRFVSDHQRRPVAKLAFGDLSAQEVLAFLDHAERDRKVSAGTRNCRLAALRSFFSYVASREPLALEQCAAILHIGRKRTATRPPTYLEPDEVQLILDQPDRHRPEGFRDYVLLSFLFHTGARIQEALGVRPQDIRFEAPPCVRLFGKGRKERFCPLWPETIADLRSLLRLRPRASTEPIFVNRYGQPLGASGVRSKLAGYVAAAAKRSPPLSTKRITPHTFRHSAGVSLVSSGNDITVIRDWLGHANLDTTSLYARANLQTKRKALESLDPPPSPRRPPSWKRQTGLIEWLESL